jgi:hypothetical protein
MEKVEMSQNLLSIALSDEDIAAINMALGDIESRLIQLVALDNDARRGLTKMGDKSEAFVRQTLMVLEQNPDIVPAAINLSEAQADLRAMDQLRPVAARLQRLSERVSDSRMALGSDAMNTALQGYGLLKLAGRNKGLQALSQALSARFSRNSRNPEPEPALAE